MAEYGLSLAARQDLLDIAAYGARTFGREQAIRYRDLLKQHFERAAANPQHYPAVDHLRPGYRRCVCGAHAIYYLIRSDDVLIVRVLGRQDARRALPDR